MVAIASCYLRLSGDRCLGFFTPLLRARGHVVSRVILKHFPAGIIPYRAHFQLKLLADQRLLNICLSASTVQVGARDNLPNTNRYKFCSRCWDVGIEAHAMCLLFLNITALFADGMVLSICWCGLIQFNEPQDCIMRGLRWAVSEGQVCLWEAWADVYSSCSWTKRERQGGRNEYGFSTFNCKLEISHSKILQRASVRYLLIEKPSIQARG